MSIDLELVVKNVFAMDYKMKIISTLFSFIYYDQIAKYQSSLVLSTGNHIIFKILFVFDIIYIQL